MTHARTPAGDSPHAFAIAGLVGWPVAHSRSPVIHNFRLREHGIAGRYVLFPVTPERVGDALRGLSALSLRGRNVTTPHKQAVMPFIDSVDPLAARARGNATVNGLGLLLNQARPAFDAWFGVTPAIDPALVRAIEATF